MTVSRPALRSRATPRVRLSLAVGLLVASGATPVAAEWDLGIEGGTVIRDGSNATSLRLRATNDRRPLTQSVYAEWLRYSGGNGYRAGYLPRYWLDERLYAFGEAEGRVDRPIRIERGVSLVGGVGYRVYDSATAGLGVEVGGGGRSTRFEALPGESDGVEESEGLGVVRAGAFKELADVARLELDVDVLQGSRLGELRAEAALLYRVPGGAIRLGYRASRITFADDDIDAIDDTQASVGFTYGF